MRRNVSIKVGNADYNVPEVFEDEVRLLATSMDWARAFSERSDNFMAAGELRLAARYARALADLCEEFAVGADILNDRQMEKVA